MCRRTVAAAMPSLAAISFAGMEGVVEEPEEEKRRGDHHGDAAHHRRLHEGALAAVGEEEHEAEDH